MACWDIPNPKLPGQNGFIINYKQQKNSTTTKKTKNIFSSWLLWVYFALDSNQIFTLTNLHHKERQWLISLFLQTCHRVNFFVTHRGCAAVSFGCLHTQLKPRKRTCPEKRDYFSREYIFQPFIFKGYIIFQGSIHKPSCVPSRGLIWLAGITFMGGFCQI